MPPRPSLLILAALFAVLPARAAPAETSGLDDLRRIISETQNDLQQKQQAQQKARQTLDKTRAALDKTKRELDTITRRRLDTWQKLQSLQNELEALKAEIGSGKAQLARLLGGQYKNRQSNAVILFLKNAEPGRKARYLEYARQIGRANRQTIDELAQRQREMQQREAEIDQELEKLEKLKAAKQAALDKLGKTHSAAQQENSRLSVEINKQNKKLANLKSDEARLNQVLADIARRNAAKRRQEAAARAKAARERLAAEQKQKAQKIQSEKPVAEKNRPENPAADQSSSQPIVKPQPPAAAKSETPPVSTLTEEDRALTGEYANSNNFSRQQGRLMRPSGGSVTGQFGTPRPGGGVWRGWFFATPPAPVRSIAEGTVAFVGAVGSYGNTVIVDHGDGYTSIYTGLSAPAVSVGGSVHPGSGIGTSGTAGEAGEGLYFEIRYRQKSMNPAAWLR